MAAVFLVKMSLGTLAAALLAVTATPAFAQTAWPAVPAKLNYAERKCFMGEIKDKAKCLGNEIVVNVKQAAGNATDNQRLKSEGVAQERKGEGQNLKGKLKGNRLEDIIAVQDRSASDLNDNG